MLATKINELCEQNGLTVSKLEKECGLGHATISKWDKSSPNLSSLKKVADYFGIPICELAEKYDG